MVVVADSVSSLRREEAALNLCNVVSCLDICLPCLKTRKTLKHAGRPNSNGKWQLAHLLALKITGEKRGLKKRKEKERKAIYVSSVYSPHVWASRLCVWKTCNQLISLKSMACLIFSQCLREGVCVWLSLSITLLFHGKLMSKKPAQLSVLSYFMKSWRGSRQYMSSSLSFMKSIEKRRKENSLWWWKYKSWH